MSVSQDGTGDYRTLQEAIDNIPFSNTCRTVIRLSPGIYKQPVYIPKTKNLITIAGLSPELTLITWNNTATKIDHHQVHFFFFLNPNHKPFPNHSLCFLYICWHDCTSDRVYAVNLGFRFFLSLCSQKILFS